MLRKKLQLKGLLLLLASSLMVQDLLAIDIGMAINQATEYTGQQLRKASPAWLSKIDAGEIAAISAMITVLVIAIYSMFQKEPSLHEQAEGLINEINLAKEVAGTGQYGSLAERVERAETILTEKADRVQKILTGDVQQSVLSEAQKKQYEAEKEQYETDRRAILNAFEGYRKIIGPRLRRPAQNPCCKMFIKERG